LNHEKHEKQINSTQSYRETEKKVLDLSIHLCKSEKILRMKRKRTDYNKNYKSELKGIENAGYRIVAAKEAPIRYSILLLLRIASSLRKESAIKLLLNM